MLIPLVLTLFVSVADIGCSSDKNQQDDDRARFEMVMGIFKFASHGLLLVPEVEVQLQNDDVKLSGINLGTTEPKEVEGGTTIVKDEQGNHHMTFSLKYDLLLSVRACEVAVNNLESKRNKYTWKNNLNIIVNLDMTLNPVCTVKLNSVQVTDLGDIQIPFKKHYTQCNRLVSSDVKAQLADNLRKAVKDRFEEAIKERFNKADLNYRSFQNGCDLDNTKNKGIVYPTTDIVSEFIQDYPM